MTRMVHRPSSAVERHQIFLNSICDTQIDLRDPCRCCGLCEGPILHRSARTRRVQRTGGQDHDLQSSIPKVRYAFITSTSSLGNTTCIMQVQFDRCKPAAMSCDAADCTSRDETSIILIGVRTASFDHCCTPASPTAAPWDQPGISSYLPTCT